MTTNNQYIVSISTTEDLGTLNMSSNPARTALEIQNFLAGFTQGTRRGTIDVQASTGTTPTGSSATMTFTSVAAGTNIVIKGVKFRAVTAAAVVANNEFRRGVSDTADAASFCTTLNASSLSDIVSATSALGVITLTSQGVGAVQNQIVIETRGIAASGTVTCSTTSGTLTTTINGVAITATAGASDTLSATAIAAAINASSDALVAGIVEATSSAGVVTVWSIKPGTIGNAITFTASGTGVTASGSGRLTGGTLAQWEGVQASGTITISGGSGTIGATINGVSVTAAFNSTDTQTATDLAAAINSSTNALVRGIVTATSSAGVVTISAVRGGTSGNVITLAATGSGATASGSGRLTSGAVATQVALGGSASASSAFPGARMGGGAGLAGNGGANASGFTR